MILDATLTAAQLTHIASALTQLSDTGLVAARWDSITFAAQTPDEVTQLSIEVPAEQCHDFSPRNDAAGLQTPSLKAVVTDSETHPTDKLRLTHVSRGIALTNQSRDFHPTVTIPFSDPPSLVAHTQTDADFFSVPAQPFWTALIELRTTQQLTLRLQTNPPQLVLTGHNPSNSAPTHHISLPDPPSLDSLPEDSLSIHVSTDQLTHLISTIPQDIDSLSLSYDLQDNVTPLCIQFPLPTVGTATALFAPQTTQL